MRLINSLFVSFLSFLIIIIPNEDPWPVFASFLASYMNDVAIQSMKALVNVFWFLEKVAAGITRFFIEESMWNLIISGIFRHLKTTMPEVLTQILFPTGFEEAGLLYIVISMAGLLMIIPGIDHKRLIDPGRVMLWAIVVTLFFISSTVGYDLINTIEWLRTDITQTIIGSEDRELDNLVSTPMMASDDDLEDYSFVLPNDFEEEYFPEPEDDDYDERDAEIIEGGFLPWAMEVKVEKESSQYERREKAQMGLAISGLTMVAATVLIMIAFILATLTASAIILVMFFLVSLPIGFFEFGSAIISGIVKQYTYIWAITFLAAILPRILIAANTLEGSESELSAIMNKVPIFIIIAIATSYVSAMAGQAMLDTFSVISTSISTAMAPLNYAGSMPAGGMLGGGPLQAGANLAGAAVTGGASLAGAAVTGGASLAGTAALAAVSGGINVTGTAALAGATGGSRAALMAGGGALIGQVSQRGGQMAGDVATGMMGERASVFTTAAQGKGAGAVARVAGSRKRRQRQEKEKAEEAAGKKFSSQSKAPEDEMPEAEQNLLNAGSCLTTNPEDLKSAEQAFEKGKYTTARHHLTRAFGSRDVANQAMKQYREHGRKGMRKVRDMTVAAQTTALTLTTDSQPLFDGEGGLTSDFQKQTWATLKKSESVDTTSQEDAALAGQIAGAAVREPTDIWRDPFAPNQLAQHINQNPSDEHPYCQDAAAAFALHDIANSQGWGEQQLEALFEAAREARALELSGKRVGIDAIAQRMNMHCEFADSLPGTNREAARLAMLILGQTKASKPKKRTSPTANELAQKTLHPDTPQVIPDLEITEEAINDLNDLATEEGWQENELTTIFDATLTARQTPLERGDTYVDVVGRNLADTMPSLMIRKRTREKTAKLALRISAGAKLDPSSKKATKPKAGATAQAPAAQAPAAQAPAAQAPAAQVPTAQVPAAQAPVAQAYSKPQPPAWWDQAPPPTEWEQAPQEQVGSELAPPQPLLAPLEPPQAPPPPRWEQGPPPPAAREQAPSPQPWDQVPPQAPPPPPPWDQTPPLPAAREQAPPQQPWDQVPPQAPPPPPPWDQTPPQPWDQVPPQAPPPPQPWDQTPPPPWDQVPPQAPPPPQPWDQAPPRSPIENQETKAEQSRSRAPTTRKPAAQAAAVIPADTAIIPPAETAIIPPAETAQTVVITANTADTAQAAVVAADTADTTVVTAVVTADTADTAVVATDTAQAAQAAQATVVATDTAQAAQAAQATVVAADTAQATHSSPAVDTAQATHSSPAVDTAQAAQAAHSPATKTTRTETTVAPAMTTEQAAVAAVNTAVAVTANTAVTATASAATVDSAQNTAEKWQRRADGVLDQGVSALGKGQKEYAEYSFSKSRQFQRIADHHNNTEDLSSDSNDDAMDAPNVAVAAQAATAPDPAITAEQAAVAAVDAAETNTANAAVVFAPAEANAARAETTGAPQVTAEQTATTQAPQVTVTPQATDTSDSAPNATVATKNAAETSTAKALAAGTPAPNPAVAAAIDAASDTTLPKPTVDAAQTVTTEAPAVSAAQAATLHSPTMNAAQAAMNAAQAAMASAPQATAANE